MGSQVIPAGTYTLMGPGGQLTAADGPLTLMEPGYGDPKGQQWKAAFDKGKGSYTLQNAATGVFVGTDAPPDEPDWILRGTRNPFAWTLADGGDSDPRTFVVASAASQALRLTPSIMRMWPPMVALGPPSGWDFEWTFRPI